jgi:hypothetical protein
VTSRKDQGQYWADRTRPYEFVPVQAFSHAFEASEVGRANAAALAEPYQAPGKGTFDALVRTKCASPTELCLGRLILLLRTWSSQE